jgi:hypothetical protein
MFRQIQGYKVSMGHMRQKSKREFLGSAVDPEQAQSGIISDPVPARSEMNLR